MTDDEVTDHHPQRVPSAFLPSSRGRPPRPRRETLGQTLTKRTLAGQRRSVSERRHSSCAGRLQARLEARSPMVGEAGDLSHLRLQVPQNRPNADPITVLLTPTREEPVRTAVAARGEGMGRRKEVRSQPAKLRTSKKANKKKRKKSKGTCFVLMPFKEPYDAYFATIIRPAVTAAGLEVVRGDSLFRPSPIMADVWRMIQDAKVLVAELTEKNANVFYELGLAHAVGKPVVLIAETLADVPFDLQSLRVPIQAHRRRLRSFCKLATPSRPESFSIRLMGDGLKRLSPRTTSSPGSGTTVGLSSRNRHRRLA